MLKKLTTSMAALAFAATASIGAMTAAQAVTQGQFNFDFGPLR